MKQSNKEWSKSRRRREGGREGNAGLPIPVEEIETAAASEINIFKFYYSLFDIR
jgi:hypothetical protein